MWGRVDGSKLSTKFSLGGLMSTLAIFDPFYRYQQPRPIGRPRKAGVDVTLFCIFLSVILLGIVQMFRKILLFRYCYVSKQTHTRPPPNTGVYL
jgi:hypothetical protein